MTSSAKARLCHGAIFVSNLDRGIEFDEKAFGLTLKAGWMTGERITDGEEETMGLPGAHLVDSKGCRIELWELSDQSGSEHTQKPVNRFGMEVDDVALVCKNAIAAGAKAEMPPSMVTSGDLHVEAVFIRGLNDERIELVSFLRGRSATPA
jgi:predicted enzyme related to lactoylglutathione lyase